MCTKHWNIYIFLNMSAFMQGHIKFIESDSEYFYFVKKIISHYINQGFIKNNISRFPQKNKNKISSIVIFTVLFKKYWICCEYLTYCPVLSFTHCFPGVWEITLGDLPYYQTAPCKANWTKCDFLQLKGSHSIPHTVAAHSQLALKESSHSQSNVSSDLDQQFTTSWSLHWSCLSLVRLTLLQYTVCRHNDSLKTQTLSCLCDLRDLNSILGSATRLQLVSALEHGKKSTECIHLTAPSNFRK